MDYKENGSTGSSVTTPGDPLRNLAFDFLFSPFNYSDPCLDIGNDQPFEEFASSVGSSNQQPLEPFTFNHDVKMENRCDQTNKNNYSIEFDWNPRAFLTDLASLEQKIHKVQDVVRSIIGREYQMPVCRDELAAQQQLVTADVTSIINQLISTAGSLLPPAEDTMTSTDHSIDMDENGNLAPNAAVLAYRTEYFKHGSSSKKGLNCIAEESELIPIDDFDIKECEDVEECESLLPGSYEVLQLEKEEILAAHTHFCEICGKGFKRDANLRMHMRGHGDKFKTPGALAKPNKASTSGATPIKRYSCPSAGCKRNKEHKDFQPLKTLLCMKNHYKRTHCDKRYTCSRCSKKKFSVLADLKTHEKHCGRDEWLCSCGTTFSRKDKLFGHLALFHGHTPALPVDETNRPTALPSAQKTETTDENGSVGFSFDRTLFGADFADVKTHDSDSSFFHSAAYMSCNFGGFQEFPSPSFKSADGYQSMPVFHGNHIRRNEGN